MDNLTLADHVLTGPFMYDHNEERQIWLIPDQANDRVIVKTYWKKVSALLDANQAVANDFSRTSKLPDLQRVASIPIQVYEDWNAEGIMDDEDAIKRRLNDSDYRRFRTNDLRL